MEKKPKQGIDAWMLVGIIFTCIGGIFLILGMSFWVALGDTHVWMLGIIFSGTGLIFFLIGAGLLIATWHNYRQAASLLHSGRYIWGKIIQFVPNYNITINGRHPYTAIVEYTDAAGVAHIFKSRSFRHYPSPAAVGRSVKVYIKDGSYKPYYVDLDGVFPQTIEH